MRDVGSVGRVGRGVDGREEVGVDERRGSSSSSSSRTKPSYYVRGGSHKEETRTSMQSACHKRSLLALSDMNPLSSSKKLRRHRSIRKSSIVLTCRWRRTHPQHS